MNIRELPPPCCALSHTEPDWLPLGGSSLLGHAAAATSPPRLHRAWLKQRAVLIPRGLEGHAGRRRALRQDRTGAREVVPHVDQRAIERVRHAVAAVVGARQPQERRAGLRRIIDSRSSCAGLVLRDSPQAFNVSVQKIRLWRRLCIPDNRRRGLTACRRDTSEGGIAPPLCPEHMRNTDLRVRALRPVRPVTAGRRCRAPRSSGRSGGGRARSGGRARGRCRRAARTRR